MQVEIQRITPEVAKSMLAKNTRNRSLKSGHVTNLARDMKSGAWMLNGEAIRLNGDGTILDGQHRLHACIRAGVPFETLVISGLPHEAQLTIDTGARRSAGDHMKITGVKYAKHVAAACRYAMIMREGGFASQSFTNTEIIDFLESNPTIQDFAPLKDKDLIGQGSLTIAGAFIVSRADPAKVDDFVQQWVHGQGASDQPLIVLRNKIIRSKIAGNSFIARDRVNAFAHAISKFLRGQTTTKVFAPTRFKIPGWTK